MEAKEYKSDYNRRSLINNYEKACATPEFRNLVSNLDVDEKIAMKYTTALETTVAELKNCQDCPGLVYCQNRLEGHMLIPKKNNQQIIFSYVPCH